MDTPGDRAGVADFEDDCGCGDAADGGGVRELHWHVEAEWAIMLYGSARITAVDQDGKSFVTGVSSDFNG
jgi:oxalate decarboxylase